MSGIDKNQLEEVQSKYDFENKKYQISMKTSHGDINIDMWPEKAPGHCKNMMGLAELGFYDGLIFHRVIPGFVIQGGCPVGDGRGGPGYQIDAEFNDLPHEAGVLSMARAQDPNSAGSQFFLCLGRVPHLDNQYTVFGKTADSDSLNVVLKIGGVETAAMDKPVEDVIIESAKVNEV